MEFWWHFGCNLAAVSRLRFTSTGNTRTATKLPPHHHQLSTKMPPNFTQRASQRWHRNKKAPRFHWVCSKTLPLLKQNSKINTLLNIFITITSQDFVCGMKGFVNLICCIYFYGFNAPGSTACALCGHLIWYLFNANICNGCIVPFSLICVSTNTAMCATRTHTQLHIPTA